MTNLTHTDLFNRLTVITEEYLGPAAERFVARQISFHLGKSPAEVSPADLPVFAEWAQVTLSLLTEDRTIIDEYAAKLTELQKESL